MALETADRTLIQEFRARLERELSADARFSPPQRSDREDESLLSSHFPVGPNLWIELTLRPFIPQARVGILTDDRWKNEDLEDAIEETGDTMSEFVELGFDEAGLTWVEPPVLHFREAGKYFVFSTEVDLERLDRLADKDLADKLRRMCVGYYEAFRKAIERAADE